MGMILRIASSRIVGQGDIVGRSGYFSLNLSANSVMRGRLDARRTLKSLVADLRFTSLKPGEFVGSAAHSNIPSFHLRFKMYSQPEEPLPIVRAVVPSDIDDNYKKIIKDLQSVF